MTLKNMFRNQTFLTTSW